MKSFKNGKIFVGSDTKTFVSAMKISHGKVVWIGQDADLNDPNAIDLNGQTVLPGLIDAHTHPKYIADALHGVACTPPKINSIKDMQAALRNSPEFGKSSSVWIEGWGFDETKLAEHRSPNIDDLDAVTTKQPIFIYRSDCHSSVGNSLALKLAGIDSNTPNPEGGFIGHFPDGRTNGYMKEVAATQLLIQAKSAQNFDNDVQNMVNSSNHYLQNGLVAIGELMGRLHPYDSLELYKKSISEGFKPKVSIYYVFDELNQNQKLAPTFDSPLRIAGLKIFMDGSISGQTAFNKVAYENGSHGVSLTSAEKFLQVVHFAKKNHLQVAAHAMGDAAIQIILDTTRNMQPWLLDRPSIRIEHASILSDEMLTQINNANMNYALVTQPIFFFAEDESYRGFLNSEQFKEIYRIKSMLSSEAPMVLSSDAPCTPWEEPDSPFVAIYAAVSRKASNGDKVNLNEAISVPEAILAYTRDAAKVGGFEQNGQLLPGKGADFVILNQDIFTVPVNKIKDIKVDQTWIDAKKVYQR